MRAKQRDWIKGIVEAAEDCDVALPWTRGPIREGNIARRAAEEQAEAATVSPKQAAG